jgi:hypothetical protein
MRELQRELRDQEFELQEHLHNELGQPEADI